MRLTSGIWVSAFLRLEQGNGAFVSVVRKGAEAAGAIFIVHNHLNGTYSLFAPAPQAFFMDGDDLQRKFECVVSRSEEQHVSDYLERQIRFDPDVWIVEIESRADRPDMVVVD